MIESLSTSLPASPDPEGTADLVSEKGRIAVAPTSGDIRPAIEKLKPLVGYRWLAINSADLFAASPATLGTKIGIIDANGRVLKAADLPRQK